MEKRETTLFYTIALTQIPKMGKVMVHRLYDRFGSAEALFREVENCTVPENEAEASLFSCIRKGMSGALKSAEAEMKMIDKYRIRTFLMGEADYPYRLKQCPDAPLLLYGLGNLSMNVPRVLAVVGSRKATDYGLEQTRKLVAEMASFSPCVVSGLAYGIDTCAHASAVEEGLPTIGVLGNGLGCIYPGSNRKLVERMLEKGGVLTEYLYDTQPIGHHFPPRNRIIAGMADAVAVMEAQCRSGALITAHLAFSYSRDVFAYPGRLIDLSSEGCNRLIAQNKAALVCGAEEVVKAMQWDVSVSAPVPLSIPFDLSGDEQQVYNLIQHLSAPDIDKLAEESGFSIPALSVILLSMECKGLIQCMSGKRYSCK